LSAHLPSGPLSFTILSNKSVVILSSVFTVCEVSEF
jgi:hypothetical protein